MVLQDASNVIFPKSLCNLLSLFLGQRNASVVVVDAQFSIKVACVYTVQVNVYNREFDQRAYPGRAFQSVCQRHSMFSHKYHAYEQQQ